MRKLLWVAGGLLVFVVLALVGLRIVGLDPKDRYPGFWLTGEVAEPVKDFTFAKGTRLVAIQSREFFLPMVAHSITTSCFIHSDGTLYVASLYPAGIKFPNGRHWNRNVMADPHVRIKIGDKLYDQILYHLPDGPDRRAVLQAWSEDHNPNVFSPGMYLNLFRVLPNDERSKG